MDILYYFDKKEWHYTMVLQKKICKGYVCFEKECLPTIEGILITVALMKGLNLLLFSRQKI